MPALSAADVEAITVTGRITARQSFPVGSTDPAFDREDVVQEGWVGCLRKLTRYDPGKAPRVTFHCLAYDPVNAVYIFISNRHTYAYKVQ